MGQQETFWMACDCTESQRAEYGPFHTREEAELEARNLGFNFLLRYEHVLSDKGEIQEVRSIFIELPPASAGLRRRLGGSIPAVPLAAKLRSTRNPGKLRCGPTFTNLNTPAIESAYSSRPALRA